MRHLTIMVFVSVALNLAAQDIEEVSPPKSILNLKTDFTNLLNPIDPGLLISIEYPILKNLTLNHEVGWVLGLRTRDEFEDFSGFKTRHELRKYMAPYDNLVRPYISLNFQYRKLTIRDEVTLGYYCENGDCAYYRNDKLDIPTHRYIWQLRGGVQSYLGGGFILELDGGFGLQNLTVEKVSSDDVEVINDSFLFEEKRFARYVSISGKLGYMLFRK